MTTLTITRGDDETLDVLVRDKVTGELVDLTDMTLWFYVKRTINDADALTLIRKDTLSDPEGVGGVTIDPDQVTNKGEATVEIAAEETNGLTGTFVWGMQARDETQTKTLAKGPFVIEADIVRA